ncbi:aprataxin and PNK-like factor [Xiphias gladius]|uniref:aprataxin and PNK-like factor n=1 Tax=Xiphias gladius TaxID=8245 RepID=UPI001A992F9D|nr:aprataxin and PNK-like factor [Xiphias gladius]
MAQLCAVVGFPPAPPVPPAVQMSGFDLVPVDGGAPVHLPPGETVLGRGPLLGVSDKRVSRHHGLLENRNGQLRIKPTHLNPCFIQSSLGDDPRPLQKDSWYPLHHGDLFSLLPGQFIYKVVAVGGEESTLSQIFEEEELAGSPEPHVEPDRGQTPPREDSTGAAPSNGEEDSGPNRSLSQRDSARAKEVEDDRGDVAPSVIKERVLPAWMMSAAAASHGSSSSPKVQSAVRTGQAAAGASTSTKRAAAKQTTPTAAPSPEEAGLSEEEEARPRKRRRKTADEEEARSKTDVRSEETKVGYQSGSNRSEISDESDNFTVEVEEEGKAGEMSTADRTTRTRASDISESEREDKRSKNGRQTAKRAESVGSNSGSASVPARSKPRPRTPCSYGKDCYRKNPVHFQECSHPGDTDYEEEEEEEVEKADRPECPYGTDCYRKNPLHRKEYKHTKKPARTARTVPKGRPAGDEDEDEDLGDDDSFIDDDSEDVGDDSDYVPPDSDDSGKEDIKRLQKEATVFLKRRK